MSDWVTYKGKPLGKITSTDDPSLLKNVFVAENLDSLVALLTIDSEDEIETETGGKMPYGKFKDEYLNAISCFYPTRNAWLFKNYRAKDMPEFEAQTQSQR